MFVVFVNVYLFVNIQLGDFLIAFNFIVGKRFDSPFHFRNICTDSIEVKSGRTKTKSVLFDEP